MNTKPVVMTILTGGGFTFEAAGILGKMSETVDFIYLKNVVGRDAGGETESFGESSVRCSYDLPP